LRQVTSRLTYFVLGFGLALATLRRRGLAVLAAVAGVAVVADVFF